MKIRALALAGVLVAGCSESRAPAASTSLTDEAAPPVQVAHTVKLPAPKELVVFFDFDQVKLTTEGERVIRNAAQEVQRDGYLGVKITGHTDTVGSAPYNYELSVRRAEMVRDELVREGVYGPTISFEGKGVRDLLVQTGAGVREPQNRRVVIELGVES